MQKEPLTDKYMPELEGYGLADINFNGVMVFHYEKGEYLCHIGDYLKYFLLIIEGRAKITVSSATGKTLLLCIDDKQGTIGSIEVMTDRIATATAQAIDKVSCIAIPIDSHINYLKNSVDFLNHLVIELGTMFARSSQNSATNILYPVQTRLCSYISLTQENGMFREKLTQVSELLGTSYRHLLRTLDALCKQNVLQKCKGGYKVLNQDKLNKLSDNYYTINLAQLP